MRPIKFRVFHDGKMYHFNKGDHLTLSFFSDGIPWGLYDSFDKHRYVTGDSDAILNEPGHLMQFTGKLDKHSKEIYEEDIFRVEEDAQEIDEEDRIYYVVITWVKEWCMFCTLLTDEYRNYKDNGITALDEPMFWSYTLEDTNDRRFFLCGNTFQNHDLLNK